MANSPFLNALERYMVTRRYAKRTIRTYVYWVYQYIVFHNKQHPKDMNANHVEQYLEYLSNDRNVAASTQATALNSLVFLYREFLKLPFERQLQFNMSERPRKLPVVLTQDEVKRLFTYLPPSILLPCQLMYGSGLRVMEAVRLRVQDIDFDYLSVKVWQGKGAKNRRVTLASALIPALKTQIEKAKQTASNDLSNPDYKGVWLPNALARKYPNAPQDPLWHYLFFSNALSYDPHAQHALRRHHIDESSLRKGIKIATKKAKIEKMVSCHAKYNLVNCYLLLSIESMCNMNNVTNLYF